MFIDNPCCKRQGFILIHSMKLKSLSVFDSRTFSYRFFVLFPQWIQFKTKYMKDFTRIVYEFHKDYIKAVTEERYGVELPLKLGKHVIVSYRSKRPYPKFVSAKDKNPQVYVNNATDGLKCKLVFTNSDHKYRVKDRYIWSFEPEVKFKKAVSEAFIKDYNKYIFSPDNQPAKSSKWNMKTREITEAKIAKFLLTYDEFKID